MKDLRFATLFAAAVLAAAGCATTKPAKKAASATPESQTAATETAPAKETAVAEANIRAGEFGVTQGLQAVYFDYDKYALADAARDTLSKNAEYLKKNPDFDALVEGHCDERGTVEYNLALGQKRAQTVRDYLVRLGVPAKQLGTISYGKEKPTCTESNEDCWAKNRRAETKVRSRTASTPRAHPEEK